MPAVPRLSGCSLRQKLEAIEVFPLGGADRPWREVFIEHFEVDVWPASEPQSLWGEAPLQSHKASPSPWRSHPSRVPLNHQPGDRPVSHGLNSDRRRFSPMSCNVRSSTVESEW